MLFWEKKRQQPYDVSEIENRYSNQISFQNAKAKNGLCMPNRQGSKQRTPPPHHFSGLFKNNPTYFRKRNINLWLERRLFILFRSFMYFSVNSSKDTPYHGTQMVLRLLLVKRLVLQWKRWCSKQLTWGWSYFMYCTGKQITFVRMIQSIRYF